MKLITCLCRGEERVGALTEEGVAFLPYPDMNTLIETLPPAAFAAASTAKPVPLEDVTLLAPIPRPRQDVICLGMNYRAHEEEAAKYDAGAFTKERPVAVYFSKRVSRAGDPEGEIPRYEGLVERLDYEAELAVILGRTARNVKAAEAGDYIFGYTSSTMSPPGMCRPATSSGTSVRVWTALPLWDPASSLRTRSPSPRLWKSPPR